MLNFLQSACVNTVPPSSCSEAYIETPSPKGPSVPIQDDGVLEQPDNNPKGGNILNNLKGNEEVLESN
ncbi:MAG: hypothetical protein P0116_15920 [Candidatus Nitrosocosmicus sp.]|nr:hypothetical protein [Candidatus Nitrosocosmicus sp.]